MNNALFRFAIASQLHRNGEGRDESVGYFSKNLQDERGELCFWTAIFTADRGYGRTQFIKQLSENNIVIY